jgi:hypothetical protein
VNSSGDRLFSPLFDDGRCEDLVKERVFELEPQFGLFQDRMTIIPFNLPARVSTVEREVASLRTH